MEDAKGMVMKIEKNNRSFKDPDNFGLRALALVLSITPLLVAMIFYVWLIRIDWRIAICLVIIIWMHGISRDQKNRRDRL